MKGLFRLAIRAKLREMDDSLGREAFKLGELRRKVVGMATPEDYKQQEVLEAKLDGLGEGKRLLTELLEALEE